MKLEKRGNVTSKSSLGKDECVLCHEEGHWKKDCPNLKKKDKGKSIFDACVIECDGDSSDTEFCSVGYQTIVGFDEWILDTGCTYHMCPHKEWFFNFEEVDGGIVYMGSGDVSYINGMGSIRLRNHDGSTRVLTDVRYVSKFKKNLISLGALESKCLVVIIRDGVLKVILGALLVMKGTRKNYLHFYNDSIVTGVVATFLVVMKIHRLLVCGIDVWGLQLK